MAQNIPDLLTVSLQGTIHHMDVSVENGKDIAKYRKDSLIPDPVVGSENGLNNERHIRKGGQPVIGKTHSSRSESELQHVHCIEAHSTIPITVMGTWALGHKQ